MEKFDRSKFKGSKLSKIKETKEDAKKKDVQLLGGGGRVTFLRVEEGRNEFRIMPAHNPAEEPPYRPMRTTSLECEVPEIKEGEETGKTIKQNRKIFIATQHGNEELRKLGKDPVELYISYVKEQAEAIDDKEDRKTFLQPITGYRARDGKWVWGILPSTNFVAYALKDNTLGRFEIWDRWVKEMDKITAAIEEEEEEILDYDPFSDVNEGYPLRISKDKNDKNKWEYTVDKVVPKKRQSWEEFCEENMVTDGQIQDLLSRESLTELYVDCYYESDFDLAVNGLQLFDKTHKIGIFENDEFLDQLEEIQKIVPAREKTEDKTTEKVEETPEEGMEEWGKVKAKKYLKAFIGANYEDEEYDAYLEEIEQLKISELRKWCAQAEKDESLPKLESPDSDGAEPTGQDDIQTPEDVETETEQKDENPKSEDDLEGMSTRRRRRRG